MDLNDEPDVDQILNRDEQALRESLERGLAQASAGDTVYLGSFARYLDDDGCGDSLPDQ
ncbi:hypothetical protein [Propionimicrobium sp. PCR01-08-3]|uniref:hypothetical protein n=1 Tax=Propionimicrobium sp. PCR01-08-3 TaxID=3052086 RepID=UPI00255CF9DB|nr:hypothetical protein [Propionimicrobium sp. PCR01-08-3]WIY82987.1 hypothetical protein QQ658_01070 [Propionimicrobium sp. PCR01-08-3]